MADHTLTPTGKNLDLSFLGKPHEHDPRRVYSTTATDWQGRVDFDRLRKDRLARARMMMEKHDLGALVCFVGENVRYITGVFQGNWKNNIFIRYCVLPRDGDPVLFETAGSDLECAKIDAPWLEGNIRPAITWKWAETAEAMMAEKMARSVMDVLTENGVEKERIGLDVYDPGAAEALERAGDQHRQRVAGHVGSARGQDPGRARVPEDLQRHRRHVVLEASSTSGSSPASARATSPRRSTSTSTSRASTSSTTSSSRRAATPARTGAGTPTRSSARATS